FAPLGVAHEVLPSELDVRLVKERIVAHPIGQHVVQPVLTHGSEVVGHRRSGASCDSVVDVAEPGAQGNAMLVLAVEGGDAGTVLVPEPDRSRADPSEAAADAVTDEVRNAERALHEWRDSLALADVLPVPGRSAAPRLGRVLLVDSSKVLIAVAGTFDRRASA